jgi:hypothetical protein
MNATEELHKALSALLERYSVEHNVQIAEVRANWVPIAGMGDNGRTHMLANVEVTTQSLHRY